MLLIVKSADNMFPMFCRDLFRGATIQNVPQYHPVDQSVFPAILFYKYCRNSILNFHFVFQVQVLFEETFFNRNDESFRVLCVSQPLEGELVCKYNSYLDGRLLYSNVKL